MNTKGGYGPILSWVLVSIVWLDGDLLSEYYTFCFMSTGLTINKVKKLTKISFRADAACVRHLAYLTRGNGCLINS